MPRQTRWNTVRSLAVDMLFRFLTVSFTEVLENVNPDLSDSEFDPDLRAKRGSSADFFDGSGTPNFGADAPTPGGADGLDMEEGDGDGENDEGSDDDLAAELERALAGEDEGDEDEEEEDEDEDETDEEEEEDGDAELTQGTYFSLAGWR